MRGLSHRATSAAIAALIVALVGAAALPALTTNAQAPANDAFERSWERTDLPVADLVVSRTWIWGPEPFTAGVLEPYADANGGQRVVQYYDKSRKERNTDPNVDESSPWYVVNGLLATELITGRLQLGDTTFEQHAPAEISIAGDVTDTSAPTYATFEALMGQSAYEQGSLIGATVTRDGTIGQNPSLRDYGVTAETYVAETNHNVASVFWNFMTSEGTIVENGSYSQGSLFEDPYFATGLPITEAYWVSVLVGGEPRDVLVQAFERRILTYTPSNDAGWRVEAGNVGRHYYEWRYETIDGGSDSPPPPPPPEPTEPTTPEPTEPTTPPATDAEPGLGTIGESGRSPLGEDEYSPLADPYLAFPESSEMGHVVLGVSAEAKLNWEKGYLPYIANTPSGEVYFVIDFNDGSMYVSPVVEDNYGIRLKHVWLARGTYYVKAWAVDPITGVRSEITRQTLVVE